MSRIDVNPNDLFVEGVPLFTIIPHGVHAGLKLPAEQVYGVNADAVTRLRESPSPNVSITYDPGMGPKVNLPDEPKRLTANLLEMEIRFPWLEQAAKRKEETKKFFEAQQQAKDAHLYGGTPGAIEEIPVQRHEHSDSDAGPKVDVEDCATMFMVHTNVKWAASQQWTTRALVWLKRELDNREYVYDPKLLDGFTLCFLFPRLWWGRTQEVIEDVKALIRHAHLIKLSMEHQGKGSIEV